MDKAILTDFKQIALKVTHVGAKSQGLNVGLLYFKDSTGCIHSTTCYVSNGKARPGKEIDRLTSQDFAWYHGTICHSSLYFPPHRASLLAHRRGSIKIF